MKLLNEKSFEFRLMKICVIDVDRIETFKEIDVPKEPNNPSIMQVEDCYTIVPHGMKVPIFIPRMRHEATSILCDYIFAKYQNNTSE